MVTKEICRTLLISAAIAMTAGVAQAQAVDGNRRMSSNFVRSLAAVCDQAGVSAFIAEPLAASESKKLAIVGTWLGTSGEGNKLIVSFTSDGIVFSSVEGEVSTNAQFGVLTPGHGVWTYLGGRQFGLTGVLLNYDINTGAYLGYVKVREVLKLNETGQQMSGTDKVEIFDPDGNLVLAIPPGNTSFTRLMFERFN